MPIKFAGKLNSFSRGPRGFFVKLEIGADDDWQELAAAPLGTTFGVAMVPINPETGVSVEASPGVDVREPLATSTGQQSGEAGKPRKPFHELSRAQQAGILCADTTFHLWLSNQVKDDVAEPADAAQFVRQLCGVHSRAELSEDRVAGKKWDQIVTRFQQDTGRMAEAR